MEPRILARAEHPISRRDIDANVLKVLYRLAGAGYEAYLVGGGVPGGHVAPAGERVSLAVAHLAGPGLPVPGRGLARPAHLKRDPEPTPADDQHFRRQDQRRAFGSAVMFVLAVALVAGSRLPHLVAGRSNPPFLFVWLGVFLLVFVLLMLALIDLLATRRYARRHRHAMLRERLNLFRKGTQPRLGHGDWDESIPPGKGFPH